MNTSMNELYVGILFQTNFRKQFVSSWSFDMTLQARKSFTALEDKCCNYTLHIQLYVFQSTLISIWAYDNSVK